MSNEMEYPSVFDGPQEFLVLNLSIQNLKQQGRQRLERINPKLIDRSFNNRPILGGYYTSTQKAQKKILAYIFQQATLHLKMNG